MKTLSLLVAFILIALPCSAEALAKTGQEAPSFSAMDSNGRKHALSDFLGKTVVLEWYNHECPYVQKHYATKNMQEMQRKYTAQGVVWLTISSSAAGKQGHVDGPAANKLIQESGAAQTAFLLDHDGSIGRQYGARTTPHMFVIDASGRLVYSGAIDNNNSSRHSSVEGAHNYVGAALDSLLAGMPIKTSSTEPYGCSVKYGG